MTAGTTYNFEVSRDEIIQDALTNVGALGPNGTPQGVQLIHAARRLNGIVKSMDRDGIHLWRVIRRTTTTTSGTDNFTPAADVLSIDEPMSYLPAASASSRTTLMPLSRDEYMSMPDRTQAGKPMRFYFERSLTANTAKLWPVPDTTGDTIEYGAIVRSRDFDAGSDTPDFPAEWTQCLLYGLSADLARAYGGQMDLAVHFTQLFEAEKEKQFNAQPEHGRTILVPFGGSY